ncbi:MAG: hypothetical protein IJY27_00895 [Clostridia bacterium]|nr:hypothetical protein [Clostridia bacterium]
MRKNIRHYFTPTASLMRKIAIFGGWLLLLLLIQSTADIGAGLGRTVPALLLTAVSALGFFDSEKVGAVAGIAAGWALDAYSGSTVALLPLVGFCIGYFSGIVAGRLLPRGILPWGVCLGAVSVINMLCTAIGAAVTMPALRPLALIWHTLLPELVLTLLWGIPTGLVTRLLVRIERKIPTHRNNNE